MVSANKGRRNTPVTPVTNGASGLHRLPDRLATVRQLVDSRCGELPVPTGKANTGPMVCLYACLQEKLPSGQAK
ncbi:hypothetical protein ZHAS_00018721 [Anopheles sinensis]|uniref:Uncharacterized protein n=1 Tax=Anopheles sinensis TaxID=74873 RepID=A0A084WKD9_ANOSI|nr:hypothetical protein ZHAS_00018721 [Anopheles sinensis]